MAKLKTKKGTASAEKKAPVVLKEKLMDYEIPISELKFPKDYNMQEIGITQSMINKFFKCRMKWFFAINRLKATSTTKRTYDFGNVVHHVLESVINLPGCLKNGELPILPQLIDDYVKTIDHAIDSSHKLKAFLTLKNFFKYCDIFETRNFVYAEKEFQRTINIGGSTDILLRGKQDCGIDEGKGEFSLGEYKCKQKFTDSFIARLPYDFQSQMYAYLNPVITGVRYLIFRNSAIRSVDPKVLSKKLQTAIDEDPNNFFKEYYISYSKQDKELFLEELKGKLHTIYSVLFTKNKRNIFKEQQSCSGFGDCDFIDVCSTNKIDMRKYHFQKKFFSELDCEDKKKDTLNKNLNKSIQSIHTKKVEKDFRTKINRCVWAEQNQVLNSIRDSIHQL